MGSSVLFIAPHPVEGPSTRFRIVQFLPALKQAGISASVRPFLSSGQARRVYGNAGLAEKMGLTMLGLAGRLSDIVRASRVDLVYVLRETFPIGPGLFENIFARCCGRLAFDFDDAIWVPATNIANPLDRLRDWERPAKIIARADCTVVGSEYLACYARRFAMCPDRIVVIPTVVDTEVYRPARRGPSDEVIVGWIGTPNNTSYLTAIWDDLAEAARREPRIRYRFVGAQPFETGTFPVEFRPWTMEREVADIQGFDIGIMPLPDDEQTRGKCGFKLIQYMACGVPAIAAAVGANIQVLDEGRSGTLIPTGASWVEPIVALARNPDARRHLAETGRLLAVTQYSLQAAAPRFVRTIQAAIG